MTCLEKDLEDLRELRSDFCGEQECKDCPFNTSRNRPCLDEAVNSLGSTLERIAKAIRRLEEYV